MGSYCTRCCLSWNLSFHYPIPWQTLGDFFGKAVLAICQIGYHHPNSLFIHCCLACLHWQCHLQVDGMIEDGTGEDLLAHQAHQCARVEYSPQIEDGSNCKCFAVLNRSQKAMTFCWRRAKECIKTYIFSCWMCKKSWVKFLHCGKGVFHRLRNKQTTFPIGRTVGIEPTGLWTRKCGEGCWWKR